ncbi:peptidyl-prolyl cis-trans isomerase-like 4 [Mizuhopecten yessoensis]|uniref:Peptidyl-prolyl cis-trans isomerase n=1 Tax=Mizuhopecten yessoensis TaxID=6573 RepID=A0A210QN94_MIZYE|nr:peptidyl-prolyl cis-trans isomerase-like 4 [Mizuhopecten yessoensis]OWF50192.1 Peptidyl-prolyl cis-trans isomerase-like 4 [Mizuhopecten yessoensis]
MAVVLETSLGDLTIDLFTDERPTCCKNFLKLCKVKYYNFSLFHSVQRNLVAQTGDPSGTGRGGESVNGLLYGEQARYFDMELVPRMKHKKVGTVSMVNNGGNMHGSQFFITLGENLDYLDGKHTVFGEVSEGLDVLMKINEAYCDEEHRPYQDIRIYHTVILDDPYDDPSGLKVPDRSPEPTQEQLKSLRIGADEEIDDFKGIDGDKIKEIMEQKEAAANAQLLEVIGDLPDADIKPPDNVLFICKLNPVTSEEDLEIIFSRFGTVESCEVIKDQKTGESLQYAFVEFEKEEDCERAYFKMDNVLIDDRRIHVDFSQSVAKIKWKGKGKGVEKVKDQDEEKGPGYVLKDRSRKQDPKYDLLFGEEEEEEDTSRKSKKKKKHKHKEERNYSDDEDNVSSKKQKKHKKQRHASRSRSRSPAVSKQRANRSRSRTPTKSKQRTYRSPDRGGGGGGGADRHRDRRDRSPQRDRHRDRSPDRYREKQSDSRYRSDKHRR